jgi:hypothetical protein
MAIPYCPGEYPFALENALLLGVPLSEAELFGKVTGLATTGFVFQSH